jgi:UDPglucose 6-dehydrogenase
MKIGVIGLGVVGSTIAKALQSDHKIVGYDIDPKKSKNSVEEVIKSDVIFLALPTPLKNGRLDSELVMKYLKKLEKVKFSGLVVIKSTLPVGFMEKARKLNLRIGYSPEFLHAKTALRDFISPEFILFSGSSFEDYKEFSRIFYWYPALNRIYRVDDKTAELTKLVMNAFASTKISFVNEIERICSIHNANVVDIMKFLRMDKRCADEYSYPLRGPYEGVCLPKDLQELISSTKDTYLLKAVHKVNERRKKYVQSNEKSF